MQLVEKWLRTKRKRSEKAANIQTRKESGREARDEKRRGGKKERENIRM